MPRVKNAKDWLLTWSPEDDAKTLPNELISVINAEWGISRGVLVAEKEVKWHCHFIFSTSRAYGSDYKWWKKSIAHLDYGPELDIKYHDNFLGCAGGYLSKDAERIVIQCYGINDQEIEYGKNLYEKRLRRKKIRNFVDDLIVINKSKIDAAIGAYMAMDTSGFGMTEEKCLKLMAEDGFAFADSHKGEAKLYSKIYAEREKVLSMASDGVMELDPGPLNIKIPPGSPSSQ